MATLLVAIITAVGSLSETAVSRWPGEVETRAYHEVPVKLPRSSNNSNISSHRGPKRTFQQFSPILCSFSPEVPPETFGFIPAPVHLNP